MVKIHFLSLENEIFFNLIFSYIKATAISPGYMVVGTTMKRNSMKLVWA